MKKENKLARAFAAADEELFAAAENTAFAPSADFERRANALVRKKNGVTWRFVNTTGKKVAAAALALLIVAAAVLTINAARVSGLFIMLDAHNDYTLVEVNTDRAEHEPPKTILQTFSPAFIPQGYRVDTVNSGKTARSVVYTDSVSYIVFTQNTVYHSYVVNAEKDAFILSSVNGYDAFYYTSYVNESVDGEYIVLIWVDEDYFYSLFLPSTFNIEAALDIAESIYIG